MTVLWILIPLIVISTVAVILGWNHLEARAARRRADAQVQAEEAQRQAAAEQTALASLRSDPLRWLLADWLSSVVPEYNRSQSRQSKLVEEAKAAQALADQLGRIRPLAVELILYAALAGWIYFFVAQLALDKQLFEAAHPGKVGIFFGLAVAVLVSSASLLLPLAMGHHQGWGTVQQRRAATLGLIGGLLVLMSVTGVVAPKRSETQFAAQIRRAEHGLNIAMDDGEQFGINEAQANLVRETQNLNTSRDMDRVFAVLMPVGDLFLGSFALKGSVLLLGANRRRVVRRLERQAAGEQARMNALVDQWAARQAPEIERLGLDPLTVLQQFYARLATSGGTKPPGPGAVPPDDPADPQPRVVPGTVVEDDVSAPGTTVPSDEPSHPSADEENPPLAGGDFGDNHLDDM